MVPGVTQALEDKPVLLHCRPDGSDPRGPLSRRCLFRGGDPQIPTGQRTGPVAHGLTGRAWRTKPRAIRYWFVTQSTFNLKFREVKVKSLSCV